jgi:hypothetical protein
MLYILRNRRGFQRWHIVEEELINYEKGNPRMVIDTVGGILLHYIERRQISPMGALE